MVEGSWPDAIHALAYPSCNKTESRGHSSHPNRAGTHWLLVRDALRARLFHQLQIEGDAHAIDQDDALIDQLLVGDFRVHELPKKFQRADKLQRLRRGVRFGRQLVQQRYIQSLALRVSGEFLQENLELWRKKQIEARFSPRQPDGGGIFRSLGAFIDGFPA